MSLLSLSLRLLLVPQRRSVLDRLATYLPAFTAAGPTVCRQLTASPLLPGARNRRRYKAQSALVSSVRSCPSPPLALG